MESIRSRVFVASCIAMLVASGLTADDASLQIRWSKPEPPRNQKISLVPVDIVLPPGLTRDAAIRSWTRDAGGSDPRWDALPAGTYRLILRAGGIDPAGAAPLELAELILAPGDEHTAVVDLPAIRAGADSSPPRSVRILVEGQQRGRGELASLRHGDALCGGQHRVGGVAVSDRNGSAG